MNFRGSNLDNSVGEIEFINTNYSNENGDYYFQDFKLVHSLIMITEKLL